MKWPIYIGLLRHGQSWFNDLKNRLENDPLWKKFVAVYEEDFQSPKAKKLAEELLSKYKNKYNDRLTPLTNTGISQAIKTGEYLKTQVELPDVVLYSPYLRCRQTFEGLQVGWPELKRVKQYAEELIVERSVGIRHLYTHWRIYHVFHPEQKEYYESIGYYDYQFPQGDNMRDVNQRVRQWFDTLIREFAGQKVFVVGHGVTIMGTRASQERMTPDQFLALDKSNPPKNCSFTLYRGDPNQGKNGRLILERYNETAPV